MIQETEQEELKSRQRKNGLKITTELAKAWPEFEEHVYYSKSKGEKSARIHRTQEGKIRNYLRHPNFQKLQTKK